MENQTAVELAICEIREKAKSIKTNTKEDRRVKGAYVDCLLICQKILEMEKQQIFNAYTQGADDEYEHHVNPHLVKREDVDAEDYYQKTFNKS